MKLYAPAYYRDFKCIADRCKHSCCVGWEIDVDEKTAELYKNLDKGYGADIRQSITDDDEGTHFLLDSHDRCPHLDSSGLCKIIKELGEEYLCEICREHPRFYNDTVRGKEVGIGLSCEEACRIVLSSDSYTEITEFCELEQREYEWEYDALGPREKLYSILSDRSYAYDDRLKLIYKEYDVSLRSLVPKKIKELINSLEYLDKTRRELFGCYDYSPYTPKEFENVLERLLAYLIYRHCTNTYEDREFRATLGFCLFLERLACSIINHLETADFEGIVDIVRIISEEIEYSTDNTQTSINCFM